MSKKRKDKELTRLQAEWYGKLKAGGFEDIEQFEPGNYQPNLKSWHGCYFQVRHDPTAFQIKAEYYYAATQYLEVGEFKSQTDRHIWQLHAEGRGVRQIAAILLKETGLNLDKDKVAAIVRSVKQQMFLAPEERAKTTVTPGSVWTQMNLFDEIS